MKGLISDIKRFTVHDGPGIRTTVFLKGCSLSCLWCHNPENIQGGKQLSYTKKTCVLCGECQKVCNCNVHIFNGNEHVIDYSACTGCGKCVDACLTGALTLYGQELDADETAQKLLEDSCFYSQSGGGVTFSGGEPLLQADFCSDVMKRLKAEGVHIAVDTCGDAPWTSFLKVLPYTDLFLYDFKHINEEAHRQNTGSSNKRILENLKRLDQEAKQIEIRIPVIPSINDDAQTIEQTGRFLGSLSNISAVRLLPYHDMARSKFIAIGKKDTMPHVPAPSKEELAAIKNLLEQYCKTVIQAGDIG